MLIFTYFPSSSAGPVHGIPYQLARIGQKNPQVQGPPSAALKAEFLAAGDKAAHSFKYPINIAELCIWTLSQPCQSPGKSRLSPKNFCTEAYTARGNKIFIAAPGTAPRIQHGRMTFHEVEGWILQ
jgi:hypothetical protein